MSYKLRQQPTREGFIKFLVDRQRIYHGETVDDSAFQFKINNIYREQDRFSRFEIVNLKELPAVRDKIYFVLIARLLLHERGVQAILKARTYQDWSDSICAMGDGNSSRYLNQSVQMAPEYGFSSAEMCWAHRYLAEQVADQLSLLVQNKPALEVMLAINKSPLFFGEFRSYEAITSFSYFIDRYTEDDVFHVGVGARKIFIELFDISLQGKTIDQRKREISAARDEVKAELRLKGFKFSGFLKYKYGDDKYTLRNFEDSMCEYRKYLNACAGKGKKYIPNKRNT